eukprot:7298480-Pyramimonas_sp.AAC.1
MFNAYYNNVASISYIAAGNDVVALLQEYLQPCMCASAQRSLSRYEARRRYAPRIMRPRANCSPLRRICRASRSLSRAIRMPAARGHARMRSLAHAASL